MNPKQNKHFMKQSKLTHASPIQARKQKEQTKVDLLYLFWHVLGAILHIFGLFYLLIS